MEMRGGSIEISFPGRKLQWQRPGTRIHRLKDPIIHFVPFFSFIRLIPKPSLTISPREKNAIAI